MIKLLCIPLVLSLTLVGLAVYVPAVTGEQYTGLGVTRQAVKEMLVSEGLNPTNNKYPDYEGNKVTELTIYQPLVTVMMFGLDDDLKTIEMTTIPSTDESETYYQALISLWLLEAAFPDWASSDRWFNRAVESVTNSSTKKKASVTRGGKKAEVIRGDAYFYLTLNALSGARTAR